MSITPATASTRLSYLSRRTKFHIQVIPFVAQDQFRQQLFSFLRAALMENKSSQTPNDVRHGLKKIPPYWYPYTTMTKMRWIGRELLEVVSTEFRDRSMEYYRYALESGVTTVNGKIAKPDTILRDGDRLENIVHRHEPPVTSRQVKILQHDVEREFLVVDKPGSIPVHASGRYYQNSLIQILVNDFGYKKCYPINRLDRLTSGLMIIPLSAERARLVTEEFVAGTVRKEYIARVTGRFPSDEVICEQPLLTVDRQMGLNIVHPDGKTAKTIFNLIRYDENTDSSVANRLLDDVGISPPILFSVLIAVLAAAHQLRVHLQFLGYPIANDPVYSGERIWGENIGKGGIDVTPSTNRDAPAPPPHLQAQTEAQGSPETLGKTANPSFGDIMNKRLPRETGEDIGMGSPVPLSSEAVGVITRLRNMKDEDEDWSRWRDVVFRAKGAMRPSHMAIEPPPPQNQRKRGGRAKIIPSTSQRDLGMQNGISETAAPDSVLPSHTEGSSLECEPETKRASTQLTTEDALSRVASMEPVSDPNTIIQSDNLYCPECYLPLHPDPKPEKLYIFLHALKYTTSLGSFSTEMPEWAAEGWVWDRS